MFATLDLTERQAARVLEQAVRAAGRVQIEPRNLTGDLVLHGVITRRERDGLFVQLPPPLPDCELNRLSGACCDVSTILAGEMYLFSSSVLEVADTANPPQLRLAVPTAVQVVNRRRYLRSQPGRYACIFLRIPGSTTEHGGEIVNVCREGLACRVPRQELDEQLLLGDPLHVRFRLPGTQDVFELPAILCTRAPAPESGQLILGLQFAPTGSPEQVRATLDRVQQLAQQAALLTQPEEPR